ncbi:MAG: tetratricopeptide repeat protein [Planctomycetota bacterium]
MGDAAGERRIAGRYRPRSELGAGSHGRVLRAADLLSGEEVAIKLSAGGTADAALRREFEVLGRLRHPHLVRAVDYGRDRATGTAYLALEHVDGRPLDGLEPFDPLDAADLLAQAARGLAFLHERGIVHGDVKPANLLVSRRPGGRSWLQIIDLGLSLREGEGQKGYLRGTRRFSAPSVLRGAPPSPRSDLYSLGVCFRGLAVAGAPRAAGVLRRLAPDDEDAGYQSARRVVADLEKSVAELAGRDDGIFLVEAPLAGRAEHLARLAAWRKRAGGKGGTPVLLLRGAAGTGKTRLLDELEHDALAEEWIVCRTVCPAGPPTPYAPFSRVLSHLARLGEEEDPGAARALGALAAELAGAGAAEGAGALSEPRAAGRPGRLLAALAAAFSARRFLILIDDGERADAGTAAFLALLARSPGGGLPPVAVAGRSEGVASLRGEIGESLDLDPLSPAAATELAAGFLGSEPDDRRAARQVAEATGGLPAFVVSAARAWARERREAGGGGVEETIRAWIPSSLRSLLAKRLAALSPAARQLAEELSVLSRPAPPAWIAAQSSLPPAAAAAALEALRRAGVAASEGREGGPAIRFQDEPLRQLLLDGLPRARREELHRRAARAWREVPGDPLAGAEVLAAHLLEAGDPAEAAPFGVAAARRYVAGQLFAEAVALSERLLAGIGERKEAAALWECLGDAHRGRGSFPAARDAYERAAARAGGEKAESALAGRLLRKQGAVAIASGEIEAAQALLSAAAARGDASTPPVERAHLHEHLAHVAFRRGSVEEAREHLKRGLAALAHPDGDPAASDLWNDLGIVEYSQGRYERAVEHHHKALAIRRRAGDLDGESRSLTNLANVLFATGDEEGARQSYEASLALKVRLGNAQGIALTLSNLALLDHRMGRFGSAIARFEECARRQREVGDGGGRIRTLASLAGVWLDKGEPGRATRRAAAAVRLARRTGHRDSVLAETLAAQAAVEIALGRPAAALPWLDEGLAIATGEGLLPDESFLRRIRGEALHQAGGDPEQARGELARAVEIARDLADATLLAPALLAEGERAADRREDAAAEARGREVLAIAERAPAPLLAARAQILVGRVRERSGAPAEAAALLHAGAAAAEALAAPEIEWSACAALAEFHAAHGRADRALSWSRRGAAILARIVARIPDPLHQETYLEAPRRARALDFLAERTRAGS